MKYRAGYKYQLAAQFKLDISAYLMPPGGASITTEFIDLSGNGMLKVRSGYAWDGVSGPAIDTPDTMLPGLVHDALYQLLRQGYLPESMREQCDDVFKELCILTGMPAFRANYFHMAVRKWAVSAASPENVKEVIEVNPDFD